MWSEKKREKSVRYQEAQAVGHDLSEGALHDGHGDEVVPALESTEIIELALLAVRLVAEAVRRVRLLGWLLDVEGWLRGVSLSVSLNRPLSPTPGGTRIYSRGFFVSPPQLDGMPARAAMVMIPTSRPLMITSVTMDATSHDVFCILGPVCKTMAARAVKNSSRHI